MKLNKNIKKFLVGTMAISSLMMIGCKKEETESVAGGCLALNETQHKLLDAYLEGETYEDRREFISKTRDKLLSTFDSNYSVRLKLVPNQYLNPRYIDEDEVQEAKDYCYLSIQDMELDARGMKENEVIGLSTRINMYDELNDLKREIEDLSGNITSTEEKDYVDDIHVLVAFYDKNGRAIVRQKPRFDSEKNGLEFGLTNSEAENNITPQIIN